MGEIDKNHIYSFTQLQTFSECPYSFYLQKLDQSVKHEDLVENSFAQQGTLIHDLIDKWAKGEIPIEDLPEEYKRRYETEVANNWPRILAAKGYAEKTYKAGLEYFENFDGFDGYEIISSEQKFMVMLNKRKFVGVIDMVMKDKDTGELIILDHKSKSLSSFKKSQKDMYKQQYLYSVYVKKKYKQYPDRLAFNLFKEDGLIMSQPFDNDEFIDVVKWAGDTMEKMESYDVFEWLEAKEESDFFCQNICSCRKICPNGKQ